VIITTSSRVTRWAAATVIILSMSACSRTADDHLHAASDTVDQIRSGVLDMRLSVAAVSAPDEPVGFAIQGPFDVAGGNLEADLTYRQVAGTATAEARFLAVNGRAFVETDGNVYELPVSRDSSLANAPTMLDDLDFEHWASDPAVEESGPDGQLTIASPLDEVVTVQALGRLLDDLDMKDASGLAVLDGLDDETLRRSVERGSMTVRVGPDDLLRGLVVRLHFGIDAASPLADALEGVAGADLVFSVDITAPNRRVTVAVPQNSHPISELPGA
jgi:hypothetical protein